MSVLGFAVFLAQTAGGIQSSPVGLKKLTLSPEVSVLVPANAKKDTRDFPPVTGIKSWAFVVNTASYIVAIIPSYQQLDRGATPDHELAEFVSGFAQSVQKPVIKQQSDLLMNGWPGLEALSIGKADGNVSIATLSRSFVVDGSVYGFAVVYPADSGRPDAAGSFLNSAVIKTKKLGPLKSAGPVFELFAPKGGGYSIVMPSKPKEELLPMPSSVDNSVFTHRFTAQYGNRIYISNYLEIPNNVPDTELDDVNAKLGEIERSVADALGTKPVGKEKTVRHGNLEFVRLDCSSPDGYFGRIEATMTDQFIYVDIMIYPSGHSGSPDIDTFFNSFKLLK